MTDTATDIADDAVLAPRTRRQDLIRIRGLRCEVLIGAYRWERCEPQPLTFDITLPCDCAAAAARDDIERTVDYAGVVAHVERFAESSRCELVETLCDRLAQELIVEFGLDWVELDVTKPGALPGSTLVTVSVMRTG